MRRLQVIVGAALLFTAGAATSSYGIAISESYGTMTADWGQDDEVYEWKETWYMNGADASSNSDDNNLNLAVYPGGNNGDATASYGSDIVGQAMLKQDSVYSRGFVSNDGTGFPQSASGTSHLSRSFTVATAGNYSFDATYEFGDFRSISDSSESVSGYHHACLSLWIEGSQFTITEAFEVGATNPLSGTLTLSHWLTAGTTYSYELHTYNSAWAFSPAPVNAASVPEPATLLLFGTGIAGLLNRRLRRRN